MSIVIHPSPNFDARPAGAVIDTIILHYTGMPSAEEALARLCDDSQDGRDRGRVSAHYMVDVDGQTYSLVDDYDRAWHAGVSYWRGRKGLNDVSIGIELVNPGHEFGYCAFPRAQMDALVHLCQSLMKKHPIRQENILSHAEVAPARKIDPGEKFNWRHLARNGIGIWPEMDGTDYPHAQFYLSTPSHLRGALLQYGFDPEASTEAMCQAFNRRYCRNAGEILTWEAAACLSWLNRNTLKKTA